MTETISERIDTTQPTEADCETQSDVLKQDITARVLKILERQHTHQEIKDTWNEIATEQINEFEGVAEIMTEVLQGRKLILTKDEVTIIRNFLDSSYVKYYIPQIFEGIKKVWTPGQHKKVENLVYGNEETQWIIDFLKSYFSIHVPCDNGNIRLPKIKDFERYDYIWKTTSIYIQEDPETVENKTSPEKVQIPIFLASEGDKVWYIRFLEDWSLVGFSPEFESVDENWVAKVSLKSHGRDFVQFLQKDFDIKEIRDLTPLAEDWRYYLKNWVIYQKWRIKDKKITTI